MVNLITGARTRVSLTTVKEFHQEWPFSPTRGNTAKGKPGGTCNNSVYPKIFNIRQYDRVTLLGVTFQSKFSEQVKAKLCEANKCLFVGD